MGHTDRRFRARPADRTLSRQNSNEEMKGGRFEGNAGPRETSGADCRPLNRPDPSLFEYRDTGRIGHAVSGGESCCRLQSRSDNDTANDSRNEQKRGGKQSDVNHRLYLVPRLGGALGTIELIHMRIRNTQIRHVLPPFVLMYLAGQAQCGYSYISYQLGRDEFPSSAWPEKN
ncbi:hypothetical protein [Rhizobium sp. SYY.PMSO]|uniref:hypothetical protein n=1 Tax=Rhizobium sp. SYY.PMSO TaxID=3382192 RepID=UPI0039900D1D